ncbi:NADP oxidoreductase [bacterium]|nr:MAG: NADP oxidoreductase [bacterium]
MKIGIIGAGSIGKTLARRLAAAGHDVKVANSRGPETIDAEALATGARAVATAEAVEGVDVVIVSIPPTRLRNVAPLLSGLPEEAVVIDTSNYYPQRDDRIEALEAGQVESLWFAEQLGRPVAKAWNSVIADTFARKGLPAGSPGRIALPVAADRDVDRKVALELVEDTGFDAYDAGSLADSWRQQPGTPPYCTDLNLEELPAALAAAERDRSPKRRDLAMAAVAERADGDFLKIEGEHLVRLNRALYL